MDLCGLINLGFEGYPYTWLNGRQEEANIHGFLDMGLATISFISKFFLIKVIHLPLFGSDHAAICIDLEVPMEEIFKK